MPQQRPARDPRRALDLCARRTIREFESLLSSSDLPEIAHVLPYSYRPPDDFLTSLRAIQMGVVFAGDAPEQSAPERARIKERLKEIGDASCPNDQTWLESVFIWNSELPPPGAGNDASPEGKIRTALDAGGWTLDNKEPLEMAGTRYAAHVRFAAASHVVGRGATQDDGFAAVQSRAATGPFTRLPTVSAHAITPGSFRRWRPSRLSAALTACRYATWCARSERNSMRSTGRPRSSRPASPVTAAPPP